MLFRSVTQKKMTVELTADPMWYAVLALPALSNPQNESAVSWAAAYYANTLAKHIVDTHPRIRQVFDGWKVQGGGAGHFMGRLQQNQDLKNLLLESVRILDTKLLATVLLCTAAPFVQ